GKELVDILLDVLGYLRLPLGRDGFVDEASQAIVVGVVVEDHAVGEQQHHSGREEQERAGAGVRREVAREPRVGVDLQHVVVPGDEVPHAPAAAQQLLRADPRHGGGASQRRVAGPRVGEHDRVGEGGDDLGGGGGAHRNLGSPFVRGGSPSGGGTLPIVV